MKLIIFISTIFILFSCNNQRQINYSKIKGIEDINEQVITIFYNNVLDSLIGDFYFESKPIPQGELIEKARGFAGVSNKTKVFSKNRWINLNQ